jgi:hypothetical protein
MKKLNKMMKFKKAISKIKIEKKRDSRKRQINLSLLIKNFLRERWPRPFFLEEMTKVYKRQISE